MNCKTYLKFLIPQNFRDGDIKRSIKNTSSVNDYYKNYGFFYLTKTSQNFANTIQSLANFEKAKVNDLDHWYTKKIDANKREGNLAHSFI